MANKIKQYIFINFDGDTFPIAYKLQEEGENVLVCQIDDPKILGTETWVTHKEPPEVKRRRMSLYDGMLKKIPYAAMMYKMAAIKNKNDCFVITGHSSLYKISERIEKMGFTNGIFPNAEDYEREKDRKKSKEFVKKNYPDLKVLESKEFKGVDETIKFIEESDQFWVVKSDGNMGETIVPDRDDLEMAKKQIVSELTHYKSSYDKGKLILEPKIMNAIEFSPEIVWYDGEPVYSQVELETRMFGSADIGDQTGGNENLIMNTDLEAKINKVAFPEAMRAIARKRRGMFITECGILSDGKDLYFTEFCANRWGWGGVFSELSGSENKKGEISNYFESIVERENPYQYKFGSSLAVYTIRSDQKFAGLNQEDLSINIKKGNEKDFFIMQCKLKQIGKEKQLVNVGYREFDSAPLGYVVGRGDTMESATKSIYKTLKGVSLKGLYYRPKFDWMSEDYVSSIPNRMKFLEKEKLI